MFIYMQICICSEYPYICEKTNTPVNTLWKCFHHAFPNTSVALMSYQIHSKNFIHHMKIYCWLI